ncbi:hypothetical protein [Streptomyces sp. NPDC002491]
MAVQCETPEYTDGQCHCAFCDPDRARAGRIDRYYQDESAASLAERVVDLEDEIGEDVDGICTGMHAGRLYEMFKRLREEEEDRADRFESAWKSARRRAKTALGAWRYTQWRVDQHDEERREADEFTRFMWGQMTERRQERDRYRLAWLSARRRAADEANMGMEALELVRRDRDRWQTGHERVESHLVGERRDNARLRAFAADVLAVRGWCMDGEPDCAHRFLRAVYDATYELEAAERERRPFRDRWTRTGHEAMRDQCPAHDTIESSIPQPAPCTCGNEAATVAYWTAELQRAHEEATGDERKTFCGTRLECVGPDGDGGQVFRLAEIP